MPLPRFDRLPAERRAQILGVARAHFARDGVDRASYNQIIEAAGISKTTAYHYFDGREDLLRAVQAEVRERVARLLGAWQTVRDAAAFWAQLEAGSRVLQKHVATHAEDAALLSASEHAESNVWFDAMFANGVVLGLVRKDVDRALLIAATRAVLASFDGWALQRLANKQPVKHAEAWTLLKGLWGASK